MKNSYQHRWSALVHLQLLVQDFAEQKTFKVTKRHIVVKDPEHFITNWLASQL